MKRLLPATERGVRNALSPHPSFSNRLIVCLSHLRWNFVYQRPQHLMSRFAERNDVLYVEEPVADDTGDARLEITQVADRVRVAVPRLPAAECASGHRAGEAKVSALLANLLSSEPGHHSRRPVLWFYTPMAVAWARQIDASMVVYDCMDQLANFMHAPRAMRARERALIKRSDLVFTGGCSLFEAKRRLHPRTHLFPSSVDTVHFRRARSFPSEPHDIAGLGHPRIGYFGVIDERLDLELLERCAATRPEWHWIFVGPVVKIDPASLPRAPNIHYLGPKTYDELPAYLGSWDVAMMPFAINPSTRFISPTKTPEYLAGGCPVVSTPVIDVVRTYGDSNVVRIGLGPNEFVAQIQAALKTPARGSEVCAEADALLGSSSWDTTHASMAALMAHRLEAREPTSTRELPSRRPAGVPQPVV